MDMTVELPSGIDDPEIKYHKLAYVRPVGKWTELTFENENAMPLHIQTHKGTCYHVSVKTGDLETIIYDKSMAECVMNYGWIGLMIGVRGEAVVDIKPNGED